MKRLFSRKRFRHTRATAAGILKSEELRRKAQNDWITLEKGQYPLNIAVQKLQMQQSDIRIKIMDINDGYERWKKDTDDLRRKGVIK